MSAGQKGSDWYPWAVVGLLWPVAMLNYLDRQMLATVRESIRADIPGIASDRDFGILMAMFMWVYALLSPLGGFLADRLGRRRLVIASLLIWSVMTCLTGLANNFGELLACRSLMGVSEAFYIPAALALIADFHPGHTRSRAIGIHQSGIYAGLALGGVGGYIAQAASWRWCFTGFGGLGVFYAVFLWIFLREPPEADTVGAGSTVKLTVKLSPLEILRELSGKPGFWILVVCFTLPALSGWFTKNWLPTYLSDSFKMAEGPAGLSATGFIQVASFFGVLLGGILADRWMRLNNRGRIHTSALGLFLLVPALMGMGFASTLMLTMACLVLFGLGWGLFDCNNMPILCQIARPELRATAYGLMNFVSISVGAAATVGFGWMRDRGMGFSTALALAALACLASVVLILRIKPAGELEHAL